MFSTTTRGILIRPMNSRVLAAFLVCVLGVSSPVLAEEQPLYRIFLQDGTSLVSYGEFARVADRVVFSIPVGAAQPAPQLNVVSIAESAVDWAKTDEYADAVRAKRYADTRGENDFALLSAQVAGALNDVALTKDPAIRLAMAEEARRRLADWPKQNYGYRAADVRQLLWLFDDVVSDLRAAAGQPRYDLALYASTVPTAAVALIAAPDFRETITQALTAARLTPDSGERMSLLRSIAVALKPAGGADWEAALRDRALADLEAEEKISRSYADLTQKSLVGVAARAARADVLGVQRIIRDVLSADDRLGRRRPQETAALLATLDTHLDAARRLRLARDSWSLRAGVLERYRSQVQAAIEPFVQSVRWVEAIRELAGPPLRSLASLEARMSAAKKILASLQPPREVEAGHSLLGSAVNLAARAAAARRNAISSTDMSIAWEASSAAAGALLMFERAVDEINRQTAFPRIR
jgi:hypothetical protein